MDKKILEEIAERAKQRLKQSTYSAPPSAPPLSALTSEFDPSAMAALSAKAALNLWKPKVALSSNGVFLESVVSADGKHFFIGTPGMEFRICAKAPPGVDFLIECFIDGRIAARRVWFNSKNLSSGSVVIEGFYVNDDVFPFVFAPSVMTSLSDPDASIVTSEAGKIRLVFTEIANWKLSSPKLEREAKPPVDLLLERLDQKFFNTPGLTVTAGKRLEKDVRPGGSASKVSELGEIVVYFDTAERLRLRGILPANPDPIPATSPAKYSRKRAKVSEFVTMIDITGDEPIITKIKKEPMEL